MTDAWDEDDPTKRKVFTLAGFNSSPAEKADLVSKISSLGGYVVDSTSWSEECTHVIAANYGQYLEKVMAGLVGGRWVITKRFVERSFQKGCWANTKAFVCDETVLSHRKRRFLQGGIFKNLKAVLLLENAVKRSVYTRIIEAGGGEVLVGWTLSDLLNNQPCSSDLNCVVVDPDIQIPSSNRYNQWVMWQQVVRDTWPVDTNLPHVYYKYVFNIITQCKILPPDQFSIFSPAVLEMARKDGAMPRGSSNVDNKRSLSDAQVATKKQKVGGEATKIVTTVVDSNVVTLSDSDSDDDIEILEQKITQRKAGSRRTYYEKPQSFLRSRGNYATSKDAELIDISNIPNDTSEDAPLISSVVDVSMEVDQDARDDLSECEEIEVISKDVKEIKDIKKLTEKDVQVEKNNEGGGISVGLQHAISALQQTSRGPVRLIERKKSPKKKEQDTSHPGSVVTTSAEENSTDDDVEIISSKAGIKAKKQRRTAPKLDTRTKMFQERLKDLLEAENLASLTEEELPPDIPPGASPSPEVPKVTEPENIPLPDTPVVSFNSNMSENSNHLLLKAHSCILERQAATDECIAVSNTSCRTARFDKNKESGRLGEVKVKPVDSTVKEEFYQKYLEKSNQKDPSFNCLSGQINQVSNCVSSLRYLRCSTSFTCYPTSGILNSLMVDYILEQSSRMVRVAAYNYLDQFLYLHLGRETEDRTAWLHLILSACRTGNNLQWDTFSLENKQDIAQCWKFFADALNQYQAGCKEGGTEQSGPGLLAQLLAKLCRKDFELWWKHFRRSDGKDGRALSFPLLYYLLDGSSNLVSNINKSIVKLYRTALVCDEDMIVVRHLVSMAGLLISHLDNQDRQSFIFSGTKVEYATHIEAAMVESYKDRQDCKLVLTELSLVQPPWLGMLVARRMVMTQEHKTKLNTICDLTSKMSQITLSSNPVVTIAVDCLAQRIISSCHIHTLFRTHWLHSCHMQDQGNSWKMMDRMDKVGARSQAPIKVFRFKSGVTFKTSNIVDDLNLLAAFVNGEKSHVGNIGAVSALIFKMTKPTSF